MRSNAVRYAVSTVPAVLRRISIRIRHKTISMLGRSEQPLYTAPVHCIARAALLRSPSGEVGDDVISLEAQARSRVNGGHRSALPDLSWFGGVADYREQINHKTRGVSQEGFDEHGRSPI